MTLSTGTYVFVHEEESRPDLPPPTQRDPCRVSRRPGCSRVDYRVSEWYVECCGVPGRDDGRTYLGVSRVPMCVEGLRTEVSVSPPEPPSDSGHTFTMRRTRKGERQGRDWDPRTTSVWRPAKPNKHVNKVFRRNL